jgi:Holliday junction DNA helicase RuvA
VIASLRGTVVSKKQNQLVIDVGGVGYAVQTTSTVLNSINIAEQAHLFTTLVVREDAFTLFGFLDSAELETFDLLRSVTGVGPKSALSILSSMNLDQIAHAVSAENDAAFKSVPGIGPKTAKLIIVTLAGKLHSAHGKDAPKVNHGGVVSALVGLGWPERSAIDAVTSASRQFDSIPSENDLLRASLALLGTSKSVSAGDE